MARQLPDPATFTCADPRALTELIFRTAQRGNARQPIGPRS